MSQTDETRSCINSGIVQCTILHLIELIIIVALAIGVVGEGFLIYNLYQAKPSVEIVEVVNDDPFADLPTVPKETIKGLK